jgi:hypothetical protein
MLNPYFMRILNPYRDLRLGLSEVLGILLSSLQGEFFVALQVGLYMCECIYMYLYMYMYMYMYMCMYVYVCVCMCVCICICICICI